MNFFGVDRRQFGALVLFFCAIAVLVALADRAPIHLEKRAPSLLLADDVTLYLHGVVEKTLPGPYVYRILVPYVIAAVQYVAPAIHPVNIDCFLKIVLLIACQLSFYAYLRIFFSSFASLAGVFLLDVLVAFTLSSIQGPSIIETSDLLNLAVFSLALIAICRNAFGFLCLLLFAGTLNRETTWLILPILLVSDRFSGRNLYRSAIAASAVALPYFVVRAVIHAGDPSWFSLGGVARNIPFLAGGETLKAVVANIHVAFLLGPLLILGAVHFDRRPRFLRIASIVTPLFIVIHYLYGTVIETRLWMPLFVILIPLALGTAAEIFDADPLIPAEN